MGIVIVDIDGVIAQPSTERVELLKKRPVDWEAFYAMSFLEDRPIYDPMLYVQQLGQYHKLVFVTSRSIKAQHDTLMWLQRYFHPLVFEFDLIMREYEDQRPAYLVKQSIYLNYLRNEKIECAIDDDHNVIKMWQGLGIKTITVVDGKVQ